MLARKKDEENHTPRTYHGESRIQHRSLQANEREDCLASRKGVCVQTTVPPVALIRRHAEREARRQIIEIVDVTG